MTKYQVKVLDELWQQCIHTRDKKCQKCGITTSLNGHHIFGKQNRNTRWNLDNGILLCAGHHTLNSSFSAHKTPRQFFAWLEQVHGKIWVDNLEIASRMIAKGQDYQAIKLYLENHLNNL